MFDTYSTAPQLINNSHVIMWIIITYFVYKYIRFKAGYCPPKENPHKGAILLNYIFRICECVRVCLNSLIKAIKIVCDTPVYVGNYVIWNYRSGKLIFHTITNMVFILSDCYRFYALFSSSDGWKNSHFLARVLWKSETENNKAIEIQ